MNGYSLKRVARLFAKHYTEHLRKYAMLCALMAFIPMLLSLMGRDLSIASDMSLAMYIIGALVIAPLTMNELRRSGSRIMSNTLPVSPAERMTFIVLNTTLVYTLIAALSGIAGVSAAQPFVDSDTGRDISDMLREYYGSWPIDVLIWIFSSAGVVVCSFARKHIITAYLIAFAGIIAAIWGISEISSALLSRGITVRIERTDRNEWIAKALYCSIPVALYAISYLGLRRRQIKW